MKKDTSKLIDLDSILNPKIEETVQTEILTELKITPAVEETVSVDIDAILTEWAWRCEKGYPNYNDKNDMIKLQEVLDEMGIKAPFKRIKITEATPSSVWSDLKKGTPNEKKFKQLLVSNVKQLKFENESIYQSVFDKFVEMAPAIQKTVIAKFQSMTIDQFANGGWKPFEGFFEAIGYKPTYPGRGEMMAVLAIKNASSGGSKEKDLQIPGGSWEIKEAPNSIRMAKSGMIGKFAYVDQTKDFYKLLLNIQLNNTKKDSALKKNLSKVFSDPKMAEDVYKILVTNFRGDGFKLSAKDKADLEANGESAADTENFFERIKSTEWPAGVIDLHYTGFKALRDVKSEVVQNKDLINNAKLILRTAQQDDKEYYINPEDSEEIATAKPGKEVKIKVATPAKGDVVEFLQNMLLIMRHPLVTQPNNIIKDLESVKNSYFTSSGIEGILYYNKGKGGKGIDPTPYLGRPNNWVIYGISQGMGKIALRSKYANSDYEWITKQK
jgi:hypothetical protein